MTNLIQSLTIVAPVFLLVLIGYLIKKRGMIDDQFNKTASKIVFNITMPALVFQEISTTNYAEVFNLKMTLFTNLAILILYGFTWLISPLLCKNGRDQGAFIQGSFRSNFAIIGFAMIYNAFGQESLARAAIVLAFIMPLYNILAVIALTVPMHKEKRADIGKVIKDIITNPLILAALAALPFSYFHVSFHPVLTTTLDYLAELTLPLALLSIGSSMSFYSIKKDFKLSLIAAAIKIIIIPLVSITAAIKLGFDEKDLGILFFFFGSPTAVASYIMAEAMGSNAKLAGNIILLSTLGSIFTLAAGLYIMKSQGYF
ncbi:MAG TPA: AEC family transporter [bacterium]|nr:AEC family transporter [bacterium]HPN44269.1 AEC family transporter [bacterium]